MPALGPFGVEESVLEMLQVAARALERRKLLFHAVRPPGQRALLRVDVRVGQPGLGGRRQTVRHEGAVVSGELPDDPRLFASAPRQGV